MFISLYFCGLPTFTFAQLAPPGVSPEPPATRAESSSSRPGYQTYPKIAGVGASVSPLGIGIEAARPLSPHTNIRGGFNTFSYTDAIQINGINYSAQLNLRSVDALLDWYVRPRFHLSPGLLVYNGNGLTAHASVLGGQTFSLANMGYVSDPANPLTGTGKLDFFKFSPMILAGFGNLAPRNGKRFSFRFEFGGVYHGTPRVSMNVAGSVCNANFTGCYSVAANPTIQRDVQAQQQTVIHDASRYGLFPLVSIGFGFVL